MTRNIWKMIKDKVQAFVLSSVFFLLLLLLMRIVVIPTFSLILFGEVIFISFTWELCLLIAAYISLS